MGTRENRRLMEEAKVREACSAAPGLALEQLCAAGCMQLAVRVLVQVLVHVFEEVSVQFILFEQN